jgi:hypothetical protein
MTELTTKEIVQQLGDLLCRCKDSQNISFRELHQRTGISYYGKIFSRDITLNAFVKTWKALDIPVSEVAKAMTQKIPELELDIRTVKCCANCVNSTKSTSFICTVTGKCTSPDLCCRKYKGE